ncbi:MAG: hypothetical protein EZS28_054915 [Streblomastix strix]|uniref:Secreted protein n=1 Tax=Streblomastix strix TaxID=222440 RepID=A0A5J4QCH3_9EUKA|nr:MAG: hypothetical protein EZS28_054915 [Streblomastix strix]
MRNFIQVALAFNLIIHSHQLRMLCVNESCHRVREQLLDQVFNLRDGRTILALRRNHFRAILALYIGLCPIKRSARLAEDRRDFGSLCTSPS